MSLDIFNGLTSQTVDLFIADTASTTGGGKTGLVFNTSGLSAWYRKGATGTLTQISLVTQTVGGAWVSGGFVEIDSTNAPGLYRLDIPNAAVDTAGFTTITLKGTALVMAPVRIDCRPVNTVTNLTNAPTAGDLTATMKTSVTTAATSSTPTVTLAAMTHTGAVVPTVTTLTNLPSAPADWLTASAVKADAVNKIQVGLATSSQVTALNNLSSLANMFGPTTMEIPDSGSTVFKFTLTVKDQEGLAVNLDSNPTITVANASGTSRAGGLSSVLNPATGEYTFTYTVASTDAAEALTFKAAGTVSAEARSAFWVSSVVDYNALTTIASIEALAQSIKDKTDQLTFTTANIVDASPTPAANIRTAIGLASANLDMQLLAIDDYLDTEIAAIKSKTDNLPTDPADQSLLEAAIAALAGYVDTEVAAIKIVTDKLDTTFVLDGSVYQFTTNALENGPGGGSSTILVYPLNASMPVKSVGPNLTFYKDESGTVVGPIQVSARSGNTVTPVDLSGRTLEVRFCDYLGTELLTVVNADITVSGTNDDQFEFEVTTAVTGTPTEDHADQYHYWSLRDVSSGDNVLVAGRARVLLS